MCGPASQSTDHSETVALFICGHNYKNTITQENTNVPSELIERCYRPKFVRMIPMHQVAILADQTSRVMLKLNMT